MGLGYKSMAQQKCPYKESIKMNMKRKFMQKITQYVLHLYVYIYIIKGKRSKRRLEGLLDSLLEI